MQNMRTARNYVINKPFKAVVLLPPSSVIKSVYPSNPDIYDSIPPKRLELEESVFLINIEEEAVIENYISSITYMLERFGYSVYGPDEMAEFISSGHDAFVFNIAQLEIMEYPDTVRPNIVYNRVYFEQAIQIKTIVQNTWIEFSQLNNDERPVKVLFTMQHTADYIDGEYRVDFRTGNMVYEYTPYRLVNEDVYDLNEFSGYQTARFAYDFLMNVYVADKTGKPFNVNNYLMIDRDRRMIRRAEPEERFFIIKLEE